MKKINKVSFFVFLMLLLALGSCSVLRNSYPNIIGTDCLVHDSCVVYEFIFHVPYNKSNKTIHLPQNQY